MIWYNEEQKYLVAKLFQDEIPQQNYQFSYLNRSLKAKN